MGAVVAWPNALQVGGGIRADNAVEWIQRGAHKVILTSFLFPDAHFSLDRLVQMERAVGRERLVVDVSCRRQQGGLNWVVAMNKWQTPTDMLVTKGGYQ